MSFDIAHAHNACAQLTQMYGAILQEKQEEIAALQTMVKARDTMIEMQGEQLKETRERIRLGTAENERFKAQINEMESRLSIAANGR